MNYEINDAVFEAFPVLQTERLSLRSFTLQDANDLFLIRSNDRVMEYLDRPHLKNVSEAEKMTEVIIKSFKEKTGINWVIIEKSSKRMVGYVGIWRLMRESVRGEIGYALKQECWGMGFMREALRKVIDFGFNQLKLHSIEGNVNPENKNSSKVLGKLGFKKEAYFRENYLFNGKFYDSEIYSLLESDLMENMG